MIEELQRYAGFREQLRDWLSANLPADWKQQMRGASEEQHVEFQKFWFRKMRDGGYVVPHWAKKWGGAELSFAEQIILYEEVARAGAPRLVLHFVSLYHTYATLAECGSPAQQQRYLPGILGGDEIWCQGFSEPNAGSDLASLKTRAVRQGDHYIVNGQKIWSSSAHLARYCLLLARTDSTAPKHQGISFFLLDLNSKGVTRRPIKMLTTEAHFNEIFLEDVEIPVENLVGEENKGWQVAQSTLSSERGLTLLELTERMSIAFDLLLRDAKANSLIDDDEIRRELVGIHARIQALRTLISNLMTRILRREDAGTGPSIIKVYYSELLQDFTALGVRIGGIDAQYWQPMLMGGGYETGYWMHDHLYSWSWTIAGGSNEIQRNIIAERALGLPREPAVKS